MRIWIIQDGEPIPGIDQGVRNWRCSMLADDLVAKGNEVVWWTSTFDHTHKKQRAPETCTVELKQGLYIRLLQAPGYPTNKSPARVLHHRTVAQKFMTEARTAPRPDVVFASLPTLELAEQSVLFGRSTGTPILIDIRDLWPDHYLSLAPPLLRPIVRRLIATEYRRAHRTLAHATGITAISESFLRWGLNFAGRDRHAADGTFPMGYPAPQFSEDNLLASQKEVIAKYRLMPDRLLVVFSGTLNSIFDFSAVLQAARALDHTSNKVQFVIAGNGPNLTRLQAEAQDLGNVIFTGWLDYLQLTAVLKFAGAGLAPYIEGPSTNGSISNKICEYMAFGLPLLSSLSGEAEQLILDERIGLPYQTEDAETLGRNIRWLAEHPAQRAAMGQRARELFEERFQADVIYRNLVAHLEQVAARQLA